MNDYVIYQDRPDRWRYSPDNPDAGDGPEKIMFFTGGVLYVIDHQQRMRVDIPVSRWKLIEIGLGCILAACKSPGARR